MSRVWTTLLAAALIACNGSSTDTKDPEDTDSETVEDTDSDTQITIATPTVRLVNDAPDTLTDLVAEVVSPEPSATLLWSWSVDGTLRADLTGDQVNADQTTKGQTWTVSVIARVGGVDSDPGTASVTIVNSPPVATVTLSPAQPTTVDPITATPIAADADGDPVTFTWRWTVDGIPLGTAGPTLPALTAVKDQRIEVTATPSDDETRGDPALASLIISNTRPVVTSANLSPPEPDTHSTLTAAITRVDADGDSLTSAYTWWVNGAQVPGAFSSTLSDSASAKGDEVWFRATVSDGDSTSDSSESNHVLITNSTPDFASVTMIPASPTRASTLSCSADGFYDSDGDPEGYLYAWTVNGVAVPGQEGQTLAGMFSKHQSVACLAAAWDGEAASEWLSASPVEVLNSRPVLSGVELSTYAPVEGIAVEAVTGPTSDADGDSVSLAYAWFVDGIRSPTTGRFLPPTDFEAGDQVWVTVTPSDDEEAGAAVTSAHGLVENTPPVATSATIFPPFPDTNDTLVASATGEDEDGHLVSFSWEWRVDGRIVQSGPTETLPVHLSAKGDAVTVTAIPFDGYSTGTPITSAPVSIVNSGPTLAGATLTPAEAWETTTLTCAPTGFSDPDGDAPVYAWSWLVGTTTLITPTDTLTGASFSRGQTVRCTITPSDGEIIGSAVQSNAITIKNSLPSLSGVTISTLTPTTGTTLTATPGTTSDPDPGDTVTVRLAWFVSGALVSTASSLPPSAFSQGDTIQVRATPYDGTDEGSPVWSATATVQNGVPVVVFVGIEPEAPTLQDDLLATWVAHDDDGDTLFPIFQWFIDGTRVIGLNDEVMDHSLLTRGAYIRVEVTVSDGLTLSEPLSSAEVLVANNPPTLDSVSITPTTAYETTTLTCVPGPASDPEGDTLTFFYLWRVNGIPLSSAETIDGAGFSRDDTVMCQASASDGFPDGLSAPVSSASVTILNTPPVLADATLSSYTPVEGMTLTATPGATSDVDFDFVSVRVSWLVNDIPVSSGTTLSSALFKEGDHVRAMLTPYDDADDGQAVSTPEAIVHNSPPSISAVSLSPSSPRATQAVSAIVTASDVDNDPIQLSYTWLIDGVTSQTGPSATFGPGPYDVGDKVWVIVTANDGTVDSAPYASAQVVIGNTPPTMTSASVNPTTVYESTTVTCNGFGWSDPDGDPPSYNYRWLVNGALDVATQTITGIRFKRGDQLICRVTPWDGTDSGPFIETTPVTVLNTAPTVGSATLSRTAPVEGNSIFVILDAAQDLDNDPLTTTYRWLINGVQRSTAAQIDSSIFNKHDTIQAEVTLSDGMAQVVVLSNIVTAVNSLPVISSVQLAPTAPDTITTVVATTVWTDADGDPVTLTHRWKVSGVDVASVFGASLPGTAFVKHDVITATVTPNDGEADGGSLTSAPATAINTAPTLANLGVTGAPLTRTTSLTCTGTGTFDLDADPVSIAYQWYVSGVLASSSQVLSGTSLLRGQQVWCVARPYDGEVYGTSLTSATFTVENSPPVLASVTMSTTTPKEGDTLTLTVSTPTDADGDPVTLAYSWLVNGVAAASTSIIDSSYFRRGDTVQAIVTPNDGFVNGTPASTPPYAVVNAPPVISGAPAINPSSPTRYNNLTASGLTGSDPDGDTVTWYYTWFANGTQVQSSTSTTLAPSLFLEGQAVYVSAQGWDGVAYGTARSSTPVTILNAKPTPPVVNISPTTPIAGVTDLVCTVTTLAYDPDTTDTVRHELKWTVNGMPYGGTTQGTTATVPRAVVGSGEQWKCEGRGHDGTIGSDWAVAIVHSQTMARRTCANLYLEGVRSDGLYTLEDGFGGTIDAWCDQTTDGGGWTLTLRTDGQEHAWGQDGPAIVDDVADPSDPSGVFATWDTVPHFQDMLLKQTAGAQSGRWAAFHLPDGSTSMSLHQLLTACRDEPAAPGDDDAFPVPMAAGHSRVGSALRSAGDLDLFDPLTGQAAPVDRLLLCGMSPIGANAVSYLTFAAAPERMLGWSGGWGPAQPGVIWSFASGPYELPTDGHLGSSSISGFAGWKGEPGLAAWMHAGTWEIYVR